jgi:hypothetical protein
VTLRASACALLLAAVAAGAAQARTERLALIVANHEGGGELPKLRYAGRDGQRLADVLVDLGSFERADILSVIDGESGDVMATLDEMERRVAEAKRKTASCASARPSSTCSGSSGSSSSPPQTFAWPSSTPAVPAP